ncbi:hypothetical protein EG329_012670 [Mollisiaceae sp. DMI_Dod_QoI]|nr:hypothetical protein EG329_012670 [Helotiales sp. DMI_Dod_QoI]
MALGARANSYNFAVTFFAALGSFTYGYNSAIMGSVIGLPSFFPYFGIVESSSKGSSITGAINGVYYGGGAIGCWTIAYLADYFGRRRCIQIICVGCIISAALQAGSVHIAMLLVARLLNGFCIGLINSIVPTYQSEIAPAAQRGRLVGSHGFIICIGYAMAGWAGYGSYFETNAAIQWRLVLALQAVAPILLLIGSPWLPESPRWLISRGRDAEGLRILERLHARPDDPYHITAREEFMQIHKQVELERTEKVRNLIQLLIHPKYRRRMLYGFFFQCLAQTTGVLVINNYQVLLYTNLGLHGAAPLLLYACFNTWASFCNWVNSMILDRFGRIRIMAIGVIGCAVCVTIEAVMVAKYANGGSKAGNAIGVLFIYLFVTFYGGCVDVSMYVYCAEIFPTLVRAQGVGFSISGLFISALLFTEVAPTAFNNIGWKYYLVFIFLPLFAVGFLIKYFPETKGLTLEEVGAKFGDEVALDLTHLTEKEREDLDRKLADITTLADDKAPVVVHQEG